MCLKEHITTWEGDGVFLCLIYGDTISHIPSLRIGGAESRASRYKKQNDAALSRAGLYALELCLEHQGLDPSVLCLKSEEQGGKPYLDFLGEGGAHSLPHFNISHTDGAALCAISSCRIGTDIESLKESISSDTEGLRKRIAKRYFSERDADLICKSDNKAVEFLRHWVAHEAIGKMLGIGVFKGEADQYAKENGHTLSFFRFSGENISKIPDSEPITDGEYIICVCG